MHVAPRSHRPPYPHGATVLSQYEASLLTQFPARQHTGMNIPPARRRIWGYLVNRTADYLVGGQDFGGEQPCQIGKVTTGDSPITHPTIENGNGGRHLFDERLGGMCSKRKAHALALSDVVGCRARRRYLLPQAVVSHLTRSKSTEA